MNPAALNRNVHPNWGEPASSLERLVRVSRAFSVAETEQSCANREALAPRRFALVSGDDFIVGKIYGPMLRRKRQFGNRRSLKTIRDTMMPNVQDEPRPWLARALLLGARIVTAMVVGSGALLGLFPFICAFGSVTEIGSEHPSGPFLPSELKL